MGVEQRFKRLRSSLVARTKQHLHAKTTCIKGKSVQYCLLRLMLPPIMSVVDSRRDMECPRSRQATGWLSPCSDDR